VLAIGKRLDRVREIEQLAESFIGAPTEDLLRWVIDHYDHQFTLACAFGPESLVLVDMLSKLQPRVRAFFLDTDFHFEETLALKQKMLDRYPTLDLTVIKPQLTVPQQDALYGEELFRHSPDQCCQLRKVEPLQRALRGYRCWMSGLRREQSSSRAHLPLLLWDGFRDMVKVNPMAYWTKREVWQYIFAHDLPYNPLLDQGYPSIGCAPCTHQPLPGQDERSGRWQGKAKQECGIHL